MMEIESEVLVDIGIGKEDQEVQVGKTEGAAFYNLAKWTLHISSST